LQFHQVKEFYNPDFNELEKAGFNKIIVRTFLNDGSQGGLLFENTNFRVAYAGFSNIVLKNSKRKFKLWGWLISRKYDWLKSDILYDSKYYKGLRARVKKLDLFDPTVREKIITVFKDLTKSGVEGILIQDDLSFMSDEGFSDKGLERFSKESGVPAKEKLMMKSGSPYNLKWIGIKKRIINKFLEDIVRECRKINQNIKIGINVYYEAAIHISKSDEWHSQDLEGIAKTDVDYIYLMMYHRQMKSELKLRKERIKKLFVEGIEYASRIAGDRLVVKLETRDWKKSILIPINEMEEYISLIPGKVRRVCFTPVKNADMKYLKRLIKAAKIEN